MASAGRLLRAVCFGIKHSSDFGVRRYQLSLLVAGILQYARRYDTDAHILVVDDGSTSFHHEAFTKSYTLIRAPPRSGLSHGRNLLAQRCERRYTAILDDDFKIVAQTDVVGMLEALERHAEVDVVGGCFRSNDCYNHNFTHQEEGRIIATHAVTDVTSKLVRTHVTHNFLVARTEALRAYPWDPRMKMLEHEPFFLNLWLQNRVVLAMPGSQVLHDRKRDRGYETRSSRNDYTRLMQYTCKAFPHFRSFAFPYTTIHCDERSFQKRGDLRSRRMQWDPVDDGSPYRYPLTKQTVKMFVGVLSHQTDRLRHDWRLAVEGGKNWSYAFFVGDGKISQPEARGDVVRLPISDAYAGLGRKVLAMLRWVGESIACDYFIKADTDTWISIPAVGKWLRGKPTSAFYGGRVAKQGIIIRKDTLRKDLPAAYPPNYLKWSLPDHILPGQARYMPYAMGGGYILSADLVRRTNTYLSEHPEHIIDNLEDVMVGLALHNMGVPAVSIPGIGDFFRPTCIKTHRSRYLMMHRVRYHGCSASRVQMAWRRWPRPPRPSRMPPLFYKREYFPTSPGSNVAVPAVVQQRLDADAILREHVDPRAAPELLGGARPGNPGIDPEPPLRQAGHGEGQELPGPSA